MGIQQGSSPISLAVPEKEHPASSSSHPSSRECQTTVSALSLVSFSPPGPPGLIRIRQTLGVIERLGLVPPSQLPFTGNTRYMEYCATHPLWYLRDLGVRRNSPLSLVLLTADVMSLSLTAGHRMRPIIMLHRMFGSTNAFFSSSWAVRDINR